MELSDIHVLILIVTALVIVYADHEVLEYVLGRRSVLSATVNRLLHWGVWLGLAGMIGTGVLLFWDAREYYFTDPAFLIKIAMVLALVCNGVLIGVLSKIAAQVPFAELQRKTRMLLFASGAISGLCWAGAALIGFFFL